MAAVETCSQESYLTETKSDITNNKNDKFLEKQVIKQHSSILVKLARSLNTHEWILIFGAIVSLYLINGTYAAVICSLCTTVPAVIHSYRVVTEDTFHLEAYQSTLCYWILLGGLTGFDHLLGNAFAYYFIKFLLMSMVYTHMVTKSRQSGDIYSLKTTYCPNASSEVTRKTVDNVVTDFGVVTSNIQGAPLTSKDSSLSNYIKWKQSSININNNNDNNNNNNEIIDNLKTGLYDETKLKNVENNSEDDIKINKHNGGDAGASINIFSPSPSHFDEVIVKSIDSEPISDFKEIEISKNESKFDTVSQTTIYSTDFDQTLTGIHHKKQKLCAKPKKLVENYSHETIPIFDGDIEAKPDGIIKFKYPFTDMHKISLTNVTNKKMLWALKTNAMDRILASPTCGLLPAGATLRLKVAIRDVSKISVSDCGHDRIAIDYTFVDKQMYAFDPGYLVDHRNEFRRKAFPINYHL